MENVSKENKYLQQELEMQSSIARGLDTIRSEDPSSLFLTKIEEKSSLTLLPAIGRVSPTGSQTTYRESNRSPTSRYQQGQLATQNLKFEQLLDVLFGSKLRSDDVKSEIIAYVKILETNYA